MPLNLQPIDQTASVPYMDLTGGLNTKKDPHALDRNQLAVSQNCMYLSGNALSKRPGSSYYLGGTTAQGAPGRGMATAQFGSDTFVLLVGSERIYVGSETAPPPWNNPYFTAVGAISNAPIDATNQYDPDFTTGGSDAVFVTNGIDVPYRWAPGGLWSNVNYGPGYLPQNFTASAPITPAYVSTLQSHLFYAGEPSAPTAVYISDAFYPERFTASIYASGAYPGSYQPLMVGFNDGIEGGNITGLKPLGSGMMVYKESAVYMLVNISLVGDMIFAPIQVSVSTGATSPFSIVEFDGFHCFLGIDGVYYTDGTMCKRISDNVRTYFEGPHAVIQNRRTAIAARWDQRYIIFFDDGNGTGVPVGYNTIGLWFDFAKLDADGYPTVGQINGMNVSGVGELRGPKDQGTVAWCDPLFDRIGNFATVLGNDFGQPIAVTFVGKSDFMADIWDVGDAPVRFKNVNRVWLLVAVRGPVVDESITFTVNSILNQFPSPPVYGGTVTFPFVQGALVGTAIVGTDIVGSAPNVSAFQSVAVYPQEPAFGQVVAIQVQETSANPWTILGYIVECNLQEVGST